MREYIVQYERKETLKQNDKCDLCNHAIVGELVRCKDCKWYMLTDHNDTEICTNKQWDISMAVYPIISADDFCSHGERREPLPQYEEWQDKFNKMCESATPKTFVADEWYRDTFKGEEE